MSLREEKESRIGSMASEHDKEKENLRTKIGELEKRTKEAENYRGHLFLEHEKERAKWALERDHLINEKSDAKDMIERLEKRKEALLRENEKFRSERGPRARVMENDEERCRTASNIYERSCGKYVFRRIQYCQTPRGI